ncbi:group II intron maturase-specific domain-containing protein [Pseudomonas aeruginosa]
MIKPSKANVATFLEKVRSAVKGNKALDQPRLIRMLNPMIRGWANYHQHVVSKATFARVDHEIWRVLWQWGRSSASAEEQRLDPNSATSIPSAPVTGCLRRRQAKRFPDGESDPDVTAKATDNAHSATPAIKLEANPRPDVGNVLEGV